MSDLAERLRRGPHKWFKCSNCGSEMGSFYKTCGRCGGLLDPIGTRIQAASVVEAAQKAATAWKNYRALRSTKSNLIRKMDELVISLERSAPTEDGKGEGE